MSSTVNPPLLIASDHAGVSLKTELVSDLRALGYGVIDLGTHSTEAVDYPDLANSLATALKEKKAELGILICGSGIGMSIAANRFGHIRAALCQSGLEARLARKHNDANVLCIGARIVGVERAKDMLREFLKTEFEGGRHKKRLEKMRSTL
jgi:ribose 5-phosphate isomerase B